MIKSPGQVLYEGHCAGNERMMSWDALPASDREHWENTANAFFEYMVGRVIISGRRNGQEYLGRVESVLPQLWQLTISLAETD